MAGAAMLACARRLRARAIAAAARTTGSRPVGAAALAAAASVRRQRSAGAWSGATVRCGVSIRALASAAAAAAAVPGAVTGLPKPLVPGKLAAAYEPGPVETGWYQWWESRGLFKPAAAASVAGGSTGAGGNVFSLVLPPPNVTGALHIGHALTVTVQDVLARWHRALGRRVVWVPGLDHAGIATQSVVEKHLSATKRVSRHDIGRDAFVREVWAWKDAYGSRINAQLRLMGASLDWSREVFTMDAARSRAVRHAFMTLHAQGLIYRSTRLVNWCSHLNTAISDIEVDTQPLNPAAPRTKLAVPGKPESVEFGLMHTLRYPVDGSDDVLLVATTRPETLFGDVAVAVHPDDARHAKHIGRHVLQPLTRRRLPIVADAVLVDPTKGTGVVKITPAHDRNDFECAKRHGLPAVNILHDDGTLNALAGPHFQGMDRLMARRHVLKALQSAGAYAGSAPHAMTVDRCSRSGDVIEPRLKPQWFVRTAQMARDAVSAVRSGKLQLLPADAPHTDTWYRWLENCEDWCISRQLWWGHRTPAYRVVTRDGDAAAAAGTGAAATTAAAGKQQRVESDAAWDAAWQAALADPLNRAATAPAGAASTLAAAAGSGAGAERWVVAHSAEEAARKAEAQYGLSAGSYTLAQDEDVLDTWFSSGLFPLSVFGWPDVRVEEGSSELAQFYPLSVLETGSDILFFWVARMVMLCTHLSGGRVPFHSVLLHPVVRDKTGRKMSKSVGNVIDPTHVIGGVSLKGMQDAHTAFAAAQTVDPKEIKAALTRLASDYPKGIPACGSDALRFALASYLTQSGAINMDVQKVVSIKHFANKLWQSTRFVLQNITAAELSAAAQSGAALRSAPTDALPNQWILDRTAAAVAGINSALAASDLGAATNQLYTFVLNDFCDVFIEFSKPLLRPAGTPADAPVTAADAPHRARTQQVLVAVLDTILRLIHPFMPYVAEELWQHVRPYTAPPSGSGSSGGSGAADVASVMTAPYPVAAQYDALRNADAVHVMAHVLDALHAYRSLRAQLSAHLPKQPEVTVFVADRALYDRLQPQAAALAAQCRTPHLTLQLLSAGADGNSAAAAADGDMRLGLRVTVSPALQADAAKIGAKLAAATSSAAAMRAKLAAPEYAQAASAEAQAEHKGQLQRLISEQHTLQATADGLRQALASTAGTSAGANGAAATALFVSRVGNVYRPDRAAKS